MGHRLSFRGVGNDGEVDPLTAIGRLYVVPLRRLDTVVKEGGRLIFVLFFSKQVVKATRVGGLSCRAPFIFRIVYFVNSTIVRDDEVRWLRHTRPPHFLSILKT